MGQYSKFIRPGCKFIAITDPNSLAAYDARTKTLVIVTTNSGDTSSAVTYDLSGFTQTGASVTGYRTSPTENLAKLPPQVVIGKRWTASLPAKSVTTFVVTGAAYSGPLGFDPRRFYSLTTQAGGGSADQHWGLLGLGGGWVQGLSAGEAGWF